MNKYQKEMARHAKSYIKIKRERYGEDNSFRDIMAAIKRDIKKKGYSNLEEIKVVNRNFEAFLKKGFSLRKFIIEAERCI